MYFHLTIFNMVFELRLFFVKKFQITFAAIFKNKVVILVYSKITQIINNVWIFHNFMHVCFVLNSVKVILIFYLLLFNNQKFTITLFWCKLILFNTAESSFADFTNILKNPVLIIYFFNFCKFFIFIFNYFTFFVACRSHHYPFLFIWYR